MVHYLGWFIGSQKTNDGAVAVESQVAIVCDDVDGRSAPCGLVGGCLAGSNIIDSANVAAVETDAGP